MADKLIESFLDDNSVIRKSTKIWQLQSQSLPYKTPSWYEALKKLIWSAEELLEDKGASSQETVKAPIDANSFCNLLCEGSTLHNVNPLSQ